MEEMQSRNGGPVYDVEIRVRDEFEGRTRTEGYCGDGEFIAHWLRMVADRIDRANAGIEDGLL